jgi:hypothetical protein
MRTLTSDAPLAVTVALLLTPAVGYGGWLAWDALRWRRRLHRLRRGMRW